jgi:hypothetical protein
MLDPLSQLFVEAITYSEINTEKQKKCTKGTNRPGGSI